MFRVSVELKNGATAFFETWSAEQTTAVAEYVAQGDFWATDEILVVLPEVWCGIHGWSYMEGDDCSECLGEFEEDLWNWDNGYKEDELDEIEREFTEMVWWVEEEAEVVPPTDFVWGLDYMEEPSLWKKIWWRLDPRSGYGILIGTRSFGLEIAWRFCKAVSLYWRDTVIEWREGYGFRVTDAEDPF